MRLTPPPVHDSSGVSWLFLSIRTCRLSTGELGIHPRTTLTLLSLTLFNADNRGKGSLNMYIESVSVLANKRFSQCWLGKELSIIFGKEFNSTPPPSVAKCRSCGAKKSFGNSGCATKRKECFFNDGHVDTFILKHVLANSHTCVKYYSGNPQPRLVLSTHST